MSVEDNYSMFEHRERQREAWLRRRPVCSHCMEHIQGSHLFDIDGVLYCRPCLMDHFQKETEDYIE